MSYSLFLPYVGTGPHTLHGLAAAHHIEEDMNYVGAEWVYAWGPSVGTYSGIESVSMIHNETHVGAPVSSNSEWLLGFNEPDLASQADMQPDMAADVWRRVEQTYPQYKLVSPAPSHLRPQWLQEMWEAYYYEYGEAPRFDALAIHSYQPANENIETVERVVSYAEGWGVDEVWITEFAWYDTDALDQIVDYYRAHPRITRYSWFSNRADPDGPVEWGQGPFWEPFMLFDWQGNVKQLGERYRLWAEMG